MPIADAFYTIHVVYSIKQAAMTFKICDAKTKIARKKSGLFLFLWYPVVLEGGISMDQPGESNTCVDYCIEMLVI